MTDEETTIRPARTRRQGREGSKEPIVKVAFTRREDPAAARRLLRLLFEDAIDAEIRESHVADVEGPSDD